MFLFELPVLQLSGHVRSGPGQWLAEAVATAGLLWGLATRPGPRPDLAAWLAAGEPAVLVEVVDPNGERVAEGSVTLSLRRL